MKRVSSLCMGLHLHVEQDGVVEKGPDRVGEDQVAVGGEADEMNRHDGLDGDGFNVKK